MKVKVGTATKAILVGRLLSQWQLGLFADSEDESAPSVSALDPGIVDEIAQLTPFESVGAWSKDLRLLVDFTFMDLYTYLVESKDKSFDKESLKSFKSLKGYRYFSDGFVQNVWVHELGTSKYTYLRCHCFASLTVKTIYTVYVCMSRNGTVYLAKCQCKAGLGQACSHVTALLFTLEDLKCQVPVSSNTRRRHMHRNTTAMACSTKARCTSCSSQGHHFSKGTIWKDAKSNKETAG